MSKSAFSKTHAVLVQLLTQERLNAGVLQADLAARLGKNQSFISRIESGQRRVDMVEFIEIAQALDISPQSLFSKFIERCTEA
jgi:transcriptional regulator with XRE-family HTH domain